MRRDESAQLMVLAAVMIAMGMAALAFVNYSALSSDEYAMSSELDDSSLMFENLKVTYGQAVDKAYQVDASNPGNELEQYATNMTRWADKHGFTIILLPENKSTGYDLTNETFEGGIVVTDGTTTFRDDVSVDLTG